MPPFKNRTEVGRTSKSRCWIPTIGYGCRFYDKYKVPLICLSSTFCVVIHISFGYKGPKGNLSTITFQVSYQTFYPHTKLLTYPWKSECVVLGLVSCAAHFNSSAAHGAICDSTPCANIHWAHNANAQTHQNSEHNELHFVYSFYDFALKTTDSVAIVDRLGTEFTSDEQLLFICESRFSYLVYVWVYFTIFFDKIIDICL